MIKKRAREKVKQLWMKGKQIRKFDTIPADLKTVSDNELSSSLADKGFPRRNAVHIAGEIRRLQDLAGWYEGNDNDYDVKEHEARTFLIMPLIMSLGWDKKRIKIEWKNKDIVLFDAPYSKGSKPIAIIESKRLWDGLGDAPEQAEKYAGQYPTCKTFIVSDGIRYKLFTKPKHARKFRFSAYLNLRAPTQKHPYKPDVDGATSFLWEMRPDR